MPIPRSNRIPTSACCVLIALATRGLCADPLSVLLEDYKSYGLPLPPRDVQFVLRKEAGSTKAMLALRMPPRDGATEGTYWFGCATVTEGSLQHDSIVEPTAGLLENVEFYDGRGEYSGFPTFPDLALAIQCSSLGWTELAEALADRSRRRVPNDSFGEAPLRPRDDRDAVAVLAWNYWCTRFAREHGDRAPIIRRLEGLLVARARLVTRARQHVIADMHQTVEPSQAHAGSIAALIDDLVELDYEIGDYPSFPNDFLSQHDAPPEKRLANLGLAAVPELMKHLDDFRLTRKFSSTAANAYTWNVRIADVAGILLDKLAMEPFAYDFHTRSGRGRSLDRAHVEHWWAQIKDKPSLQYFMENAVVETGAGGHEINASILHLIGQQHPDKLVEIFEREIDGQEYPTELVAILAESGVEKPDKLRILRKLADHKSERHRLEAIEWLVRFQHPDAIVLLVAGLRAIPRTPFFFVRYDETLTSAWANVVTYTADERAWSALSETAGRVDVGQVLQIIEGVGHGRKATRERAISFIAGFLDDQRVRNRASLSPADFKTFAEFEHARKVDPFDGFPAGFLFHRLSVRDFAAMTLAEELKLDAYDSSWTEDQWKELRDRVRAELAKARTPAEESRTCAVIIRCCKLPRFRTWRRR